MSGEAPEKSALGLVGAVVAGVAAGVVLAGCFAGPFLFALERKAAAEARRGWNLVPVVVAAVDLAPGTVVTFEMISQRAVPEQFVTSSVVKPDSASYVVGQASNTGARAGDVLLWSGFETALKPSPSCAEAVDRVLRARTTPPSPGLSQLAGAITIETKTAVPARR